MSVISKLEAKEILDSRGNPTVSVSCTLVNNGVTEVQGIASVPSGASTGKHEAYELRDNDIERYGGKGVLCAVDNINGEISLSLLEKELNQKTLDETLLNLDGTKNKSRLGANAILAVSLAFARACANEDGLNLYEHLANLYFENKNTRIFKIPQPAFNIINGGKHSNSGLSFQEFMIIPEGFKTIREKVEVAKKITNSLKSILLKDGQLITMGDEGGFAPKLQSNKKALDYLEKSILEAGYDTNRVKFGLDVAATTFFKDNQYFFEDRILNAENMVDIYEDLYRQYKIISIEDGLYEEDYNGFAQMNKRMGDKINVVGDDLTVTNVSLIEKAIHNKSINTLLIKPNQIGTLSETLQAIKIAKENNIKVFLSHRSGETDDTFIADLAVAVGSDFIKAGAPTKNERIVKYNRLIEIEDLLDI